MVNPPDLSTAPGWALAALAREPQPRAAPSAGVTVRYHSWNAEDAGKPGLLFVHGFRGHARWWDYIAPQFMNRHRVYAMDLSGMGDSDHRDGYPLLLHSGDIAAVIEHAGIGPATIVGHSYGGGRVLRLCAEWPELVARAITIDSLVFVYDSDAPRPFPARGRKEPFPDYATARSRYRLLPDQPSEPWALDYIARHSLKPVDDGWHWKFDVRMDSGAPEPDGAALLSRIRVPVDYVYGENSTVLTPERSERIVSLLPRGRGPVALPFAGHHAMLDQPLATIGALHTLLASGPG